MPDHPTHLRPGSSITSRIRASWASSQVFQLQKLHGQPITMTRGRPLPPISSTCAGAWRMQTGLGGQPLPGKLEGELEYPRCRRGEMGAPQEGTAHGIRDAARESSKTDGHAWRLPDGCHGIAPPCCISPGYHPPADRTGTPAMTLNYPQKIERQIDHHDPKFSYH